MGTIIGSEKKQPIDGATVTLTVLDSLEHKGESLKTITGHDGIFKIPAAQEWGLYVVPLDPYYLSALISIKMAGYQAINKKIGCTTLGPAMTDLGIITLKGQ